MLLLSHLDEFFPSRDAIAESFQTSFSLHAMLLLSHFTRVFPLTHVVFSIHVNNIISLKEIYILFLLIHTYECTIN